MKSQSEMQEELLKEHLCLRCCHAAVCRVPPSMPDWYIVIAQCLQFDSELDVVDTTSEVIE